MDEPINYLCIEYKNTLINQYGKCYLSFDQEGNLKYENISLYTLQEIEAFLKVHSKKEILNQLKRDNIYYFLNENTEEKDLEISIRYHQNGKERSIIPLTQECLRFNIEEFFLNDLNDWNKKIIYNKLGGYLTNPKIGTKTREWIKKFRQMSSIKINQEFKNIPYFEQREIRKTIFFNIIRAPELLENKKEELILKRTRKDNAA